MDFVSKLKSVNDAQTADFTVIEPERNAAICILVLAMPTHPARLALKRKYERALSGNIKRSRDVGRALTSMATEQLDDEEMRFERQIEELVASTLDWKGPEGEPAETAFDAKAMEALYRDQEKEWLRKQVSARLLSDEGFTKSSPTRSSPTASSSSA